MRTRTLIVAIALLALPGLMAAQGRSKWFGLTWSMASPTQNSQDFVSDYSFRGLGLEWLQLKGSNSFGLSLGWNAMNDEGLTTQTADQADLTGFQFRYINAYSILLAGHHYLGEAGRVRPFLGVKAGTYYIDRRIDVGLWRISDNNWHVGVAPEIGFAVPMAGNLQYESFYTAVRYNYAVAAGDAPYQSWVSVDVGFAVRR
jgi:hypothetical protein